MTRDGFLAGLLAAVLVAALIALVTIGAIGAPALWRLTRQEPAEPDAKMRCDTACQRFGRAYGNIRGEQCQCALIEVVPCGDPLPSPYAHCTPDIEPRTAQPKPLPWEWWSTGTADEPHFIVFGPDGMPRGLWEVE